MFKHPSTDDPRPIGLFYVFSCPSVTCTNIDIFYTLYVTLLLLQGEQYFLSVGGLRGERTSTSDEVYRYRLRLEGKCTCTNRTVLCFKDSKNSRYHRYYFPLSLKTFLRLYPSFQVRFFCDCVQPLPKKCLKKFLKCF